MDALIHQLDQSLISLILIILVILIDLSNPMPPTEVYRPCPTVACLPRVAEAVGRLSEVPAPAAGGAKATWGNSVASHGSHGFKWLQMASLTILQRILYLVTISPLNVHNKCLFINHYDD